MPSEHFSLDCDYWYGRRLARWKARMCNKYLLSFSKLPSRFRSSKSIGTRIKCAMFRPIILWWTIVIYVRVNRACITLHFWCAYFKDDVDVFIVIRTRTPVANVWQKKWFRVSNDKTGVNKRAQFSMISPTFDTGKWIFHSIIPWIWAYSNLLQSIWRFPLPLSTLSHPRFWVFFLLFVSLFILLYMLYFQSSSKDV